MTYEISINLAEILRTTLYLLEHTQYTGKTSNSVQNLRKCLLETLDELESVNREPSPENQTGTE